MGTELKNEVLVDREVRFHQFLMCITKKRNDLVLPDCIVCTQLQQELHHSRELREKGTVLPSLPDVHMDGQLIKANTVLQRCKGSRIGPLMICLKSHRNCSRAKAETTSTFNLF